MSRHIIQISTFLGIPALIFSVQLSVCAQLSPANVYGESTGARDKATVYVKSGETTTDDISGTAQAEETKANETKTQSTVNASVGSLFSDAPVQKASGGGSLSNAGSSGGGAAASPGANAKRQQPYRWLPNSSQTTDSNFSYTAAPATGKAIGIVVIDPGHQGKGDNSLEPIGPGSSEKKPKVASGAAGESLVNLQVAVRLMKSLQAAGVKVIMVRTKENVNISNSERAKIANNAKADLFIRLHCDGGSSDLRGLSTQIPGKNKWTGPIVAKSRIAGAFIHKALIAETGAKDRGLVPRSDLSGFNWSKVPTVLPEMGFLSNPAERKLLHSAAYQNKLVKGMTKGIVVYLKTVK